MAFPLASADCFLAIFPSAQTFKGAVSNRDAWQLIPRNAGTVTAIRCSVVDIRFDGWSPLIHPLLEVLRADGAV